MRHETFSDGWYLFIDKGGKVHGPFTEKTPAVDLAPFVETWSENTVVFDFASDSPIDPEQLPTDR